ATSPFPWATCHGNEPGQALNASVIFVPVAAAPVSFVEEQAASAESSATTDNRASMRFIEILLNLRPAGGQVPRADQATEGVADDAGGDQGRDLGVVVRRRALHHLDAGQRALGDELDELEDLPGQEAARLGPAGAGDEGGVEAVD